MVKKIIFLFLLLPLFAGNVQAANETQYEKAILSLMWDDINKVIVEKYDFEVSIWNEKILNLNMLNGLTFQITIQGDIFVGAHNTIGTDTMTFKRDLEGLVLIDYKHTPSKHKQEILDWYFKKSVQP